MNKQELQAELVQLITERTELAVQHKAGKLKETHKLPIVRRKIANVKRLLAEAV